LSLKNHFYAKPIIFITVLCIFFSPFSFWKPRAFALSVEDEKIMGQKFMAYIMEHFEFVENDFANDYINDLGHYLIKPLQPKYFPFNFYVVKENSMNAFAGPGGHIFFFSGLIGSMDTADELAAIMCHEIGHVSARHIAERIELNKKIGFATLAGVLAGALIGGKAGGGLIAGTMAAGIQTQLHYSRKDEQQADQLSFTYMEAGGFNPAGMIVMLNKIQKESWLGTDRVPTYLLTHPTGPERMASLDSMMTNYTPGPPKKETARFRELFPFFKTIVRAKSLDTHDAERLFNLDLEKNPDSALPYFGLGIVYAEKSEYEPALRHLKKAQEINPDFIPILTSIGEVYQMKGEYREAISIFEKALKLDGEDKSTLFLLGLTYEHLKEYGKAARLFEKLASFAPVKNEVYYHLGIAYGRRDMLAQAHYYFGVYFKELGQSGKAKFHFDKAKELAANDTALLKKINEAEQRHLY
jgi:predicted Zn-dependent protease